MTETPETYPSAVWSDSCAPGGYVCAFPNPKSPDGVCGLPVESEPCPEHSMRPEDVPDSLVTTAADAHEDWQVDNCMSDDLVVYRVTHEAWARATIAAVLPAVRAAERRAYHAELFGTPEEITARAAEPAKRDDPAELCERLAPGHHERRVRAKVPKPVAEMLAEFHAAIGDKPGTGLPGIVFVPERTIRRELLAEEYQEYLDAELEEDRVGIADALADMVYVIYGTAYTYGIPLDRVIAAVHASNMTKDFVKGGKAIKGERYQPPDIAAVLGEQP